MKKTFLDWLTLVLVIIGGINWGLIGIFNFDLVKFIFSFVPSLIRVVYTLVGLSALYMIYFVTK